MNRLPWRVTVVAWLYIVIGAIGLVGHRHDGVLVELVEVVAIVAGVFVLRGSIWARWLAMAWILFHVVLSAFHGVDEFAMHSVFCVVIAWVLFKQQSIPEDAAAGRTPPAGQ